MSDKKKPRVLHIKNKPKIKDEIDYSLILEKREKHEKLSKLEELREQQFKDAYPELPSVDQPKEVADKKKKKGWLSRFGIG
ncbi:MAG TPA: hypothetical protein VGQ00_04640 [Candidatus Norongarragalinales archaeon]|jgi:hypothetical protein|nr:hypothetical protein [Candidatus Norongarragalinales archaeon]